LWWRLWSRAEGIGLGLQRRGPRGLRRQDDPRREGRIARENHGEAIARMHWSALDPKSARSLSESRMRARGAVRGPAGGLMAVGLGRDGPQRGETLERSKAEENGEREEGEGADARAPCDREREGGGTGVGWSRPGREPGHAS